MAKFKPLRLGLIGLGRWGINYAQTIRSIDGLELFAIATKERRPEQYGGSFHTCNWRDLLHLDEIDGVIIASSPETHYEIATTFLTRQLPVILEKPACYSVVSCKTLKELSIKYRVPCIVGYTHIYSSAFRALRRRVQAGEIPLEIRSTGVSYGPFRANVGVMWDWGSHDVAMCIDYLCETPLDISIELRESELCRPNACIYYLELRFPSGVTARCRFGNISSVKERTFWVVSQQRQICYDGLGQQLVEINCETEQRIDYSRSPRPLTNLVIEFADCIRNHVSYHKSTDLAIEVTNVIQYAEAKLKHTGGGQ